MLTSLCRTVVVQNCQNVQSQECRDEIVTKEETQCTTVNQQQCRNISEVKYVTQEKEVKISIKKRILYRQLNTSGCGAGVSRGS